MFSLEINIRMSKQWNNVNLMKEAKKWYDGDISIRSLDKRLLLCLFKLRVLSDLYEKEDSTVPHSFKNQLNYLERDELIAFKDDKWIITEKGVQLIEEAFCFLLYKEELEWRPPDLFPEDFRAR